MKYFLSTIIAVTTWLNVQAQQETPPLPPQIPPVGHSGPQQTDAAAGAVGGQAAPTQTPTNATAVGATGTAQAGAQTNGLTPTGRMPMQTQTDPNAEAPVQVDFSITNTLATLPPAHSNGVVQLRTQLTALQSVIIKAGSAQNLQVNILQNPQVLFHVRQLSGQITALARGNRPSQVLVQRLASDLVRAVAPVQLQSDRLLVLAVVIDRVANADTLTSEQLEQLIHTTTTTLQSSGVPVAASHPVTCDLHALAYEIHPALAGQ
jgi:hypothetical protein